MAVLKGAMFYEALGRIWDQHQFRDTLLMGASCLGALYLLF